MILRILFRKNPGGIAWVDKLPKNEVCDYVAGLIFEDANELRKRLGLSVFSSNEKLTLASYNHALRMSLSSEFAHELSDGVDLTERVERCWYCWKACRENIALYPKSSSLENLAREIHEGLVNSPGHYANLIATDCTELGVAVVQCVFDSNMYYAVQNFGSRQFGVTGSEPAQELPSAMKRNVIENRNSVPSNDVDDFLSKFRL